MAKVRVIFYLTVGILCGFVKSAYVPEKAITNDDVHHDPIIRSKKEGATIVGKGEGLPIHSKSTSYFLVSIDSNEAIHVVDRRFLSVGLSAKAVAVRSMNASRGYDPNSVILQTLLRGLAPSILRVGGRAGDEVIFALNGSSNSIPHPWININHFLTGEHWKSLNEFCLKSGADLAFTLNVALRKGGAWDPTNAKELLDFNANLGYRVIWELGNEPALFKKNYHLRIPARQLAKDFNTLRNILSKDRYRFSNELVGPDMDHLPIAHCGNTKTVTSEDFQNNTDYLRRFLKDAGDAINATTVHFYNLNRKSETLSVDNFTNPDTVNLMRCELKEFRKLMKDVKPTGARWLGETSSVAAGGLRGVSNRYVAGFIILHNLGVAAEMGISVFIYWDLTNGPYSLLDVDDYTPTPLYWICFLHKRLTGTHVLSVSYTEDEKVTQTVKSASYVHVFAHCTKVSLLYPVGAVTIIAINLHNDTDASLFLTENLMNKNIDEYLLTAPEGNLTSSNILLNGYKLEMKNSTHFPDINPRPLPIGYPIVLPPRTYGFYVIKDADALVCRKHETKY
ncbi:heparanase-like [Lytechinus pictus]|uniref:heparanase-like n=1 Tax=Lytechinus pictus TaxID=7653 RepID=UPI0030BA0274